MSKIIKILFIIPLFSACAPSSEYCENRYLLVKEETKPAIEVAKVPDPIREVKVVDKRKLRTEPVKLKEKVEHTEEVCKSVEESTVEAADLEKIVNENEALKERMAQMQAYVDKVALTNERYRGMLEAYVDEENRRNGQAR